MGRIDLVIESVESQSVIIIENKIYHWLHNDLQNYWDTFKRYKNPNKKGILLTLNPEKPTNSNFVNITHINWVNKILQRGIPSSISEKHKMYLNDFIENIKRLTNRIVMNDGIKFYLENSYEVEQVIKFRENASMYIIEKINNAASYFNWCVYGNEYKQMWDEINGVRIFYTLFPKQIMVNKELKFVIEIDSVAREYYDRLMESLNEEDFFDNNFKKTNEKNNFFAHILYYQEKLDVEDFDSLDEKIISIITEKLELKRKHIIKKLVEFGYSDKKNY